MRSASTRLARALASSASTSATPQALVFGRHGAPHEVISLSPAADDEDASGPPPGCVSLRVLASPVNHADLDVVRGRYPPPFLPSTLASAADSRRSGATPAAPLPCVGGAEALCRVVAVGAHDVEGGVIGEQLAPGDHVIVARPRALSGTWTQATLLARAEDLHLVPHGARPPVLLSVLRRPRSRTMATFTLCTRVGCLRHG